jgi:hypothetical protein
MRHRYLTLGNTSNRTVNTVCMITLVMRYFDNISRSCDIEYTMALSLDTTYNLSTFSLNETKTRPAYRVDIEIRYAIVLANADKSKCTNAKSV